MSTTPTGRPPARSGFCNPSFVYGVGNESHDASHARCHKDGCPCGHHLDPHALDDPDDEDPEPRLILNSGQIDQLRDAVSPAEFTRLADNAALVYVHVSRVRGTRVYSWWRTYYGRLTLLPDPTARYFPELSVGPFSVVTDRTIPRDEVRLVHVDGSLAAKVRVK